MPKRLALLLACLLVTALPARAHVPPPTCEDTRARNFAPATGTADGSGDVRVYAIQYMHEIRHVETYETFRRKMFCLVEELVMPTADADDDGKADRPTIVAFNEDAGLATIASGTRGFPARALAEHGRKDPATYDGAKDSLISLAPMYATSIAYYANLYPETSPQRLILSAATDNFARGFMKTNADVARHFGVYVVSSNNQAEFKVTRDPVAIAALADPDLAASYATGDVDSVYEAVDVPGAGIGRAGIDVYNWAFMWSPDPGVTSYAQQRYTPINGAPLTADDPRANIIHATRKTPLTSIERNELDLSDDRDVSVENTGPFTLPDVPQAKIGYGISLPSFMWGSDFGKPFAGEPCGSSFSWMRCLDARGVNLFLQPEANPGCCWADFIDRSWEPHAWQALSWMNSAWRAVADPTVTNIRYAVTPHIVGNLVDLAFDGQSVILERCDWKGNDACSGNPLRTFVGAYSYVPCNGSTPRCDDPKLEPYAGLKREFLSLAPWVLDDCPACAAPSADRDRLAARARAMLAGSGSAFENGYLETAVWADLDLD